MRSRLLILLILSLISGSLCAQNPKWFKKARKSQVTIIAYNAQDQMLQGQGIFLNEQGDVVAEYDILKGAVRATVIDCEGKEYQLTTVAGANSLYNTVRCATDSKKVSFPEMSQSLETGKMVYIMPVCSTDKKAVCITDTIAAIQEFDDAKYPYYTLSKSVDQRYAGCPVFNEEGELVGQIQMSAKGSDKPAYVLGVQYSASLSITALDANNSDLNTILIPKALPEDENQAITFLYLMNKQNPSQYEKQVKMFIEKYPKNTTGYIQLAELKFNQKEYKAAEEIFNNAMNSQTQNEDELHHSFAKLLYQSGLQQTPVAEGWDMAHALKEAQAAYSCNPLPLYTALEGLCFYALGKYEDAYDKFFSLKNTNMRSAEYFLYASQCKEMLKAPAEEILALQDSAVNCFTKPYPADAASYIYLRAKTLSKLEKFREAVSDMNEFEHLNSGNVSAKFCYEREQMEMQCRQFQNALNDIERAVSLSPEEPLFRAEEAVVNYRVGQFKEAAEAARQAIRLEEGFADAHRILGICLHEMGQNAEAKKSLQRAIELGDEASKKVLEQMK